MNAIDQDLIDQALVAEKIRLREEALLLMQKEVQKYREAFELQESSPEITQVQVFSNDHWKPELMQRAVGTEPPMPVELLQFVKVESVYLFDSFEDHVIARCRCEDGEVRVFEYKASVWRDTSCVPPVQSEEYVTWN